MEVAASLKVATLQKKVQPTVLLADLQAIAASAVAEASASQGTGSPTLARGEGIIALPLVALLLPANFLIQRSDRHLF